MAFVLCEFFHGRNATECQSSAKNYRLHLHTHQWTAPFHCAVLHLRQSASVHVWASACVTVRAVQTQHAGPFYYWHIFHNFSCLAARGRPNILHHKFSPRALTQSVGHKGSLSLTTHTYTHPLTHTVVGGLETVGRLCIARINEMCFNITHD